MTPDPQNLVELEKKLQYCVREELYEEAAQISLVIRELKPAKANRPGSMVPKKKSFMEFLDAKSQDS